MRILIDLESGEVRTWAGAAITSLPAKFRDNIPLEVRFSLGGIAQELAAGYSGQAGVKAAGEYAGDFLALDSAWVKSGTGTGTVYTFDLDLNTVEFATAFTAEPASVAAVLEVQITDGSTVRSSQAVALTVSNDYIQGDEGLPTAGTPAYPIAAQVPIWRVDITALTGGTGSSLDTLVTAGGLYTSRILIVFIGSAAKFYTLVAGTDAEASPAVIRPDDYNASTNAKVWKLVA